MADADDKDILPIRLPPRAGEQEPDAPKRRGWLSSAYMVGVVIFAICLARLYIDQYIEIRKLTVRRNEAKQELEATRERHARIAEEVEYLETLEGVERLARDKLRYIRPDEVILVPLRPEG